MDTRHLKTFVTLAKIQNYTRTAQQLGYAQSSISAQIQQLEEELGTPLFDRIGKRVYLNASGETFLGYAQEMLALQASATDRTQYAKAPQKPIVVGASESLCISVLPSVIRHFRQEDPLIQWNLRLIDNDQALPLLQENQLDLAFTLGYSHPPEKARLWVRRREPIVFLCHPDHPLGTKGVLNPQDFQSHGFVLTGPGCNLRPIFQQIQFLCGGTCGVVLETGSIQVIKEMTLSGLGISILPRLAAERELAEGRLIALPYTVDTPIYAQLYSHPAKWIPPYLESLIDGFRLIMDVT